MLGKMGEVLGRKTAQRDDKHTDPYDDATAERPLTREQRWRMIAGETASRDQQKRHH
jgi:hypothetical protein